MAGFLRNFTTGLRISLCAKQVCINIERLSPVQGARLALMTALLRIKMVDEGVPGSFATISQIVQHPTAYRKEICYTAFCLLEEIREESREKIRSYASFGVLPSPEIKWHTETCDLALSLLMSTMGVGYKPSTLDAVKYSWERLATYVPTADDVTLIMHMPEHVISDIMEMQLETEAWLEMARKSPNFLNTPV